MENIFVCRTTVRSNYKLGEPITLNFELTNKTDKEYYILKWNNPLEGLLSEYVLVKLNGKKVSYDGPFLTRVNPVARSYILVKAGESVSATINLADAYYFCEEGEYEITVNAAIVDYIPNISEACKPRKIDKFINCILSPNIVKINVIKGGEPIKTSGMIQREKEGVEPLRSKLEETESQKQKQLFNKSTLNKVVSNIEDSPHLTDYIVAPKPPTFIGATSEQKDQIKTAHYTCYRWSQAAAINVFNKDNLYETWFGTDEMIFDKIYMAYSMIYLVIDQISITYNASFKLDPSNDLDPEATLAFSYFGTRTIFLFNPFFAQDKNDQSATIVHEMAHLINSTIQDLQYKDSYYYGEDACKELAKESSNLTVYNADNYAFYAKYLPNIIKRGLTVFHQGKKNSGKLWFSTSFIPNVWYSDALVSDKVTMSFSPSSINDNSELYCFYQKESKKQNVYYTSGFNNGKWNDRKCVDNALISHSPAVVAYDNRTYCFYQGHKYSGELWYAYTDDYSTWNNILISKAELSYSPSVIVYEDTFYCFFQGKGNSKELYFIYNEDINSNKIKDGWKGNTHISEAGTIKTSPSVVETGNRLYCFYQGKNDSLCYVTIKISDIDTLSWNQFIVPDTKVSASPSAMIIKGSSIYCFHQGKKLNGELWYNKGDQKGVDTGELIWSGDRRMDNVGISSSPGVIPVGLNINQIDPK